MFLMTKLMTKLTLILTIIPFPVLALTTLTTLKMTLNDPNDA